MNEPEEVAGWLRDARVRVFTDGRGTIVRLRGFSPAMACIAALAVAIVVCGFAYPVAAMAFSPQPVPPVLLFVTGGLVIVVAVLMTIRRHHRIRSGCEDLIIDDDQRTLTLPQTFGRDAPTLVKFDQVTEVAPAEDLSRTGDILDAEAFGERTYNKLKAFPGQELPRVGHRSEMQYVVLLCWRDDAGAVESPIVKWSGRHRARALAFWLRARLGCETRPNA